MNTTTFSTYGPAASAAASTAALPLPGAAQDAPAPLVRPRREPASDLPRTDLPRTDLPKSEQPEAPLPVGREAAPVVPLDAFARQGGPDASIETDTGMISVHAVFQMDPTTRELTVSVVDADGRLIRMIPPDSVASMLAAMATYRGR